MIPRRVVLENFLSFGAPAQAIDFTDDEPLWMLCGPNGVGKSAVFDAITYALFGCHRGGKGQGMDDLVRHGANGFRVEFEFGVGPREFRITRSRGKKSVERVFQKHGDDWKELDVGGGRDAVRAWAERELGLTFEQDGVHALGQITTLRGRELKRGHDVFSIPGIGAHRRSSAHERRTRKHLRETVAGL